MNPYQSRIDNLKEELRVLESQEVKETPPNVTVTMRPVCECGYIFQELCESYSESMEQYKKYPVFDGFTPSRCPSCNKSIESVISRDMQFHGLIRQFTI